MYPYPFSHEPIGHVSKRAVDMLDAGSQNMSSKGFFRNAEIVMAFDGGVPLAMLQLFYEDLRAEGVEHVPSRIPTRPRAQRDLRLQEQLERLLLGVSPSLFLVHLHLIMNLIVSVFFALA